MAYVCRPLKQGNYHVNLKVDRDERDYAYDAASPSASLWIYYNIY